MTLLVRDVVYAYPDGEGEIPAVNGASFTVNAGEMVALYGPSGSGKTTLLNLAAGLDHPHAGRITFEGARVDNLDRNAGALYRRRVAGVVEQTPALINGASVLDNAAMTLLSEPLPRSEAHARAVRALARVGIDALLHQRLPGQLSGGQRQRVALARALAIEPRLLLADEPTGNLDTDATREILELLHASAQDGIAVLLVTHDPAASSVADRCLTMVDGRVQNLPIDSEARQARQHDAVAQAGEHARERA